MILDIDKCLSRTFLDEHREQLTLNKIICAYCSTKDQLLHQQGRLSKRCKELLGSAEAYLLYRQSYRVICSRLPCFFCKIRVMEGSVDDGYHKQKGFSSM